MLRMMFAVLLLIIITPVLVGYLSEDPAIWGVVFIVSFATYPFVSSAIVYQLKKLCEKDKWMQRLTFLFGLFGVALAIWLNYPTPKIKMVAPMFAIITFVSCAITGAMLGASIDA